MKNSRNAKSQKLFRKVLRNSAISILILSLTLAGLTIYAVRASFPQESGKVIIPGLESEVKVQRDKWGIPQIYAFSEHDLYLAQGYIHAQDRFWQMDFWRHIGSGTLSEMFGKSQLDKDEFLRTMGWQRIAQQEFATLDSRTKANLQAYADGVNKYLQNHQGSALSLEYAVLKFLNRDYSPEPWQPIHSLTWGKVMAYDLGQNMNKEIERMILLTSLTQARVDELFPPYPQNSPIILPNFRLSKKEDKPDLITNTDINIEAIIPSLQNIANRITAIEEILGPTGTGIGSNSWVISGKRTATGKPIVANDPHLAVQIPSIWYEVGLHCVDTSKNCFQNVTGFSFAGVPGVIVGHNNRIAWGVTNVISDTMDLYIEKINPENPNQYEVNGKWVDMQLVKEEIRVANSAPVNQTVRYTKHGPIISDVLPKLQKLPNTALVKLPAQYAISLRWTALQPSQLMDSFQAINRAQSWQEFRTAASKFDIAAQNLVYADIDGNIGYQMPGKVPIRKKGDGRYPVPGWNDEHEWLGYIDFEDLPNSLNPPSGYIFTANNAVVDDNYPYVITKDWVYGYRAKRIEEMISNANRPLTLADMKLIQGDNLNLNARYLLPILKSISFDGYRYQNARQLLMNWDLQLTMNSPVSTVFETFWQKMLALTFHDELPSDYYPDGDDRWYIAIEKLASQPNNLWWDNRRTPNIENRDEIFKQAFIQAIDELTNTFGDNPEKWTWGKLHQVNFRNGSLGKSGVAIIEKLFNRGTYATAGNGETVNANRWRADKSSFEVTDIPSFRMIIDLGNFENSLAIHSTGQSGHAFHRHYIDMVESWRHIQYHSLLWGSDNIARNTESTLLLTP